eukprot:g13480.t1
MLDAEAENCNRGGADQLHQKSEHHQALLKASAALREFGTAGNLLQVDIVLFQKSMGKGENSRSLLHTIRAQMFEWGGDMEGFKVPDESGNGSRKYNEKRAEKGWRVRGSHVGEGGDAFYAPLAPTYDARLRNVGPHDLPVEVDTNFLVRPVEWLRWKILLVRDDEDTLRMLKDRPLVEHEIEDRLRHAKIIMLRRLPGLVSRSSAASSRPPPTFSRFFAAAAADPAEGVQNRLLLTMGSPHDSIFKRVPIDSLTAPGREGSFTVTNNHSQLVSQLQPGVITVKGAGAGDGSGALQTYFISDGFLFFNHAADASGCCTVEVSGFEIVPTDMLDKEKAATLLTELNAGPKDSEWDKAKISLGSGLLNQVIKAAT